MADGSTTSYSFTLPEVGASQDSWGTKLNANWSLADDLFDGTTAIAPNLSEGSWKVGGTAVTSTAAELNILDGVTATAAELNILDGVTSTAAELNILDGVTSTAAEINLLDGSVSNSITNSKAVIYGSAGQVRANTINLGNYTVTETSGVLVFSAYGTDVMKIDEFGNLTVIGNVTAYGTV
jgi:hypothetical protein